MTAEEMQTQRNETTNEINAAEARAEAALSAREEHEQNMETTVPATSAPTARETHVQNMDKMPPETSSVYLNDKLVSRRNLTPEDDKRIDAEMAAAEARAQER